tara:strand:+ start:2184 stop:3140 length:957 start_codon:yes stop_codon:yes gene_type:complete
MAQNRKPRPKTQREISEAGVEAYTGLNPNDPTQYSNHPNIDQSGIDFNRSEQMSQKGDTYKEFTVGIQDIDEALMYYFENVIRPTVFQNGERIAVPIIYGAPERWKSFQKDGYYRDQNGKIMNPIIMFKRDNIVKKRNLTNKLDANFPNLYTSWQKQYNSNNFYSNFNLLNNRVQTKQFIANVVPDYVTLTYSVTMQTYYIEQLNKIIEAVNYASDSYWGNPERFKFNASIDQFNTIQELNDGQERVVRSTFTINMYGYIIPDIIQKDLASIKKYNSKSKIIFSMETSSDPNVFDSNPQVTDDGRTRRDSNVDTRKRM